VPPKDSSQKAAALDTTTAHFDALGRPFLTIARNRVLVGPPARWNADEFYTRVGADIEGNQRAVRDERKLPKNYLPTGAFRTAYGRNTITICSAAAFINPAWRRVNAGFKDVAGQTLVCLG
jgi:hypothetical protein